MLHSARADDGYTLPEVLVAFTILVLALSAIYARLSVAMHTTSASENYDRAAEVADRVLTELGHSRPLAYGVSEGDLPADLHWRLQVTPLWPRPDGATLPREEGHKVVLTMSWPSRLGRESIRAETVLLGMEQ